MTSGGEKEYNERTIVSEFIIALLLQFTDNTAPCICLSVVLLHFSNYARKRQFERIPTYSEGP